MRRLVCEQHQWTGEERRKILDYCASDVDGLVALLPRMAPSIDWPRALLRGRYMKAVARMERTGIPIDATLHRAMIADWDDIKIGLIAAVDADFGVYRGTTFKAERFAKFLSERRIAWPKNAHGVLKLDDDTFGDQARRWPELQPLRELRATLGGLRLTGLEAGLDGRNRCLSSPFKSATGRNQPSNTSSFSPGEMDAWSDTAARGVWARLYRFRVPGDWNRRCAFGRRAHGGGLPGRGPLYGLCEGCEVGSARRYQDDAQIDAGALKSVVLGINYGMGPETLAMQAGITPAEAKELLRLHKETYKPFWRWSEDVVAAAMLTNEMKTVLAGDDESGASQIPGR